MSSLCDESVNLCHEGVNLCDEGVNYVMRVEVYV